MDAAIEENSVAIDGEQQVATADEIESQNVPGDDSLEDTLMPAAASAERCQASMVLGAVGDAMGYRSGNWEFCASTSKIIRDLDELTSGRGIRALDCSNWMVSDDTVEHLATAEGLVRGLSTSVSMDAIMCSVARETKKAAKDFTARAPGKTEQRGIKLIDNDGKNWRSKPFDSGAVGCGAAMRTACIGLIFRGEEHFENLVAIAVETSRLTKTHPTGYLGGVCASAFTSFALQGVPVLMWGRRFLDHVLPACAAYVLREGQRHIRENQEALREGAFESKWRWYLQERGLQENGRAPLFPAEYGAAERDIFYSKIAQLSPINPSGKNPGSKGYDSVLIAYDALLWVETQLGPGSTDAERWAELCHRAVLHRGDNDSTGSIAASWHGALHGFQGVPLPHYQGVEYRGRCQAVGLALDRAFRQIGAGRLAAPL